MHEKLFRRNQFNFWIVIVESDFCFYTYFNHCVILNSKVSDHFMYGFKFDMVHIIWGRWSN